MCYGAAFICSYPKIILNIVNVTYYKVHLVENTVFTFASDAIYAFRRPTIIQFSFFSSIKTLGPLSSTNRHKWHKIQFLLNKLKPPLGLFHMDFTLCLSVNRSKHSIELWLSVLSTWWTQEPMWCQSSEHNERFGLLTSWNRQKQ